MGILRAAGERGIIEFADRILERGAELLPAFAEIGFARPAKDAVGEIGRAKTGEADQLRLLLRRGRALIGLDLGREPDGGDVVAPAILPCPGKQAIADETEVGPARGTNQWGGACADRNRKRRSRSRGIGLIIVIVRERSAKGGYAEAEA